MNLESDEVRKEMFTRLLEEGDPRVFNRGDIFDRYPDVSGAKQFWNRMHSGETVPSGWINASDFESEMTEDTNMPR